MLMYYVLSSHWMRDVDSGEIRETPPWKTRQLIKCLVLAVIEGD